MSFASAPDRSTPLDRSNPTPYTSYNIPSLLQQFLSVRQRTLNLCSPLLPADYELQAEVFTSPAKWHLAHTTWFFETFILKPYVKSYTAFHPQYEYLFNSYYNGIGAQYPRAKRGLLSRPTLEEVFQYRSYVEHAVCDLITNHDQLPIIKSQDDNQTTLLELMVLGINHEQQHQELLLTDLLYSWSVNPLAPIYQPVDATLLSPISSPNWVTFSETTAQIGVCSNNDNLNIDGFFFDNETPRHKAHLSHYSLASHTISNKEYLEFIHDNGYQRPELWLSDGWEWVNRENIFAPLYWKQHDDQWYQFTLHGLRPIDPKSAVHHVSYYEADAFARWSGNRLPTEFEWEYAAQQQTDVKNSHWVESDLFIPSCDGFSPIQNSNTDNNVNINVNTSVNTSVNTKVNTNANTNSDTKTGTGSSLFGSVWQWTSSSYSAYPGFNQAKGAVGEYNGKFMCNQMVLRGGSCLTPSGHVRSSYRNFFYPHERWQMTGIRLAK